MSESVTKRKIESSSPETAADGGSVKKQKLAVDVEELKKEITEAIEAKYGARIVALEETVARLSQSRDADASDWDSSLLLSSPSSEVVKEETEEAEKAEEEQPSVSSVSDSTSKAPSLKRTETPADGSAVKHKFGASSFTFLKSQTTPLGSFSNGTGAPSSTEPSPATRHTFGSTTPFGSGFGAAKPKNVFDSLPSFGAGAEEPVHSSFGSKANFGNAFQQTMSKKSFLDEAKPEESAEGSSHGQDEELASTSSSSKQQYKQVDLAPVERFTGEEDESTLFTTNAKLFELDITNVAEGWKERGVGHLRLNRANSDPGNVRLLMRSQALLKVILNMKITASTTFFKGMESSLNPGKFLRMNSLSSSGSPIQYLLKFGSQTQRDELISKIEGLQAQMK